MAEVSDCTLLQLIRSVPRQYYCGCNFPKSDIFPRDSLGVILHEGRVIICARRAMTTMLSVTATLRPGTHYKEHKKQLQNPKQKTGMDVGFVLVPVKTFQLAGSS